jgi:hypothetical protein
MMTDEEIKPYLGYQPGDLSKGSIHVAGGIGDNLNYVQPLTGLTLQVVKPTPCYLTLSCGIRIDYETGEVIIPEGLALSDAAQAFWAAVQRASGYRTPGFW